MMTSAAERPSSRWRSTGTPRPLSSTVTELSLWTTTPIAEQKSASASSIELSTTSNTTWWRPRPVIGVTDVHPGAGTNGIEPFEDFNVLSGVGFDTRSRRLRSGWRPAVFVYREVCFVAQVGLDLSPEMSLWAAANWGPPETAQ